MRASWIEPIADTRWPAFVAGHTLSCAFHTRPWLEALRLAYGYRTTALAIEDGDGRLTSAIVFCRIESWLTGARLVSLPFSDHADPLVDNLDDHAHLMEMLRQERAAGRWKYVEFRPSERDPGGGEFVEANRYYLHRLDLRPPLEQLSNAFHKNHVLRKIRRAEREQLTYREGTSDDLLRMFYALLLQTRRRHSLPPQPLTWFRAILQCLPREAKVRVAFKGGAPIASILTLRDRRTMIYKYGASAAEHHALGGMHLLFWKTIQEARELGCTTLDFGRSETKNEGLIAFKEHWGAARTPLVYWRYPGRRGGEGMERLNGPLARRVFSLVPDRMLIAAGATLYRHIG
jgi:hypothetical protein